MQCYDVALTLIWRYTNVVCPFKPSVICFMSYLVSFCSCVFSVLLALRLPRLGKRELILVCTNRTFVRYALVWFCLFLSSSWCLGRAAVLIVALPGFFSYFFLTHPAPVQ